MQSFAAGDDEAEIDHDLLNAPAVSCEDALLERLPVESWERLQARAARVPMSRLRDLGDYEAVARVELTLRNLAGITLKAVSRPYSGQLRSPQWDRLIQKNQTEYDTAKERWEQASRERSGRALPKRRSGP